MIKEVKKLILGGFVSLSCMTSANAALIVTQNNDAVSLANLLTSGTGVVTANQVATGAASAFGTFTGGIAAGIGIESGIVLSTGNVTDAVGPNSASNTTTNHGTAGSSLLQPFTTGSTFDAALLEFEFTTTTGDIFFNYVFASEEYNQYVNTSFNDVFAFLFNGVNIALIPGTSTPVTINTVNGGNPVGTNAQNEQFYNNNDGVAQPFNIEYDGFTNVFAASVTGLTAGTYNITLGIADVTDSSLDSAVFIEAGSFSDTNPNEVPAPGTSAIMLLALVRLIGGRRFRN